MKASYELGINVSQHRDASDYQKSHDFLKLRREGSRKDVACT